MRSASSITTRSMSSSTTVPDSMRSSRRPGHATRMSVPCLRALTCFPYATPPYTVVIDVRFDNGSISDGSDRPVRAGDNTRDRGRRGLPFRVIATRGIRMRASCQTRWSSTANVISLHDVGNSDTLDGKRFVDAAAVKRAANEVGDTEFFKCQRVVRIRSMSWKVSRRGGRSVLCSAQADEFMLGEDGSR